MDIRQATVSSTIEGLADGQIEDLLGMQNANLLNLPENYTFKYCELSFSLTADSQTCTTR